MTEKGAGQQAEEGAARRSPRMRAWCLDTPRLVSFFHSAKKKDVAFSGVVLLLCLALALVPTGFEDRQPPDTVLWDALPLVEAFFGLKRYSAVETARLEAAARAGDTAAYEALGMALKDYEMDTLEKAFSMSQKPAKDRPSDDDVFYLSYGYYEPFTVTLTHILNQKAGIGWTTYSHTGLPTPVSVIGPGAELFNGYYDNTDIFKKVTAIGQF
jgi:hypothetical protein